MLTFQTCLVINPNIVLTFWCSWHVIGRREFKSHSFLQNFKWMKVDDIFLFDFVFFLLDLKVWWNCAYSSTSTLHNKFITTILAQHNMFSDSIYFCVVWKHILPSDRILFKIQNHKGFSYIQLTRYTCHPSIKPFFLCGCLNISLRHDSHTKYRKSFFILVVSTSIR